MSADLAIVGNVLMTCLEHRPSLIGSKQILKGFEKGVVCFAIGS